MQQVEQRKLFSRPVHATLDYASVALAVVAPRAAGCDPVVTGVCDAGAAFTMGYTALTRHEGGWLRMLPMPAHLNLDLLLGAGFLTAAVRLKDEPTAVRLALAGFGLFAVFASQNSEERSL